MRIEDIEIHCGRADFDYEPVRRLEAKCEATMAFSPAPTLDEMNGKLRSMAAKLGADAIIEVEYNSGVSLTSWKSMKGTGLAVRKISDMTTCPVCAEPIKRKAIKCRHCGEVIEPMGELAADFAVASSPQTGEPSPDMGQRPTAYSNEPLRETNNPQMWLIAGAILFVLFIVIGAAG